MYVFMFISRETDGVEGLREVLIRAAWAPASQSARQVLLRAAATLDQYAAHGLSTERTLAPGPSPRSTLKPIGSPKL